MFWKNTKYSLSGVLQVFIRLMMGVCLPVILVTLFSACSPIWSRMKRRVEADLAAKALLERQNLLYSDSFVSVYQNWVPEAEGAYSLQYLQADSSLDIKTSRGLTLWYRQPLEGDYRIFYEAFVVDKGDSLDRVSDLDCFWMASDPRSPDSLFNRMEFRKGAVGRNYSLQLYNMSVGGNSNTLTRFRRFNGNYDDFHQEMKRPDVLCEYRDKAHLISPNHWYTIEIRMKQGRIQYLLDGETLVDFVDSAPLLKGWFGVRSSENHLRIRNFKVYKL
jgi:Domain of Unknown Function (DUF1080).